jgi:hypothetical protein
MGIHLGICRGRRAAALAPEVPRPVARGPCGTVAVDFMGVRVQAREPPRSSSKADGRSKHGFYSKAAKAVRAQARQRVRWLRSLATGVTEITYYRDGDGKRRSRLGPSPFRRRVCEQRRGGQRDQSRMTLPGGRSSAPERN